MINSEWMSAVVDISYDDDLTRVVDLGKEYEYLMVHIPTIDSANLSVYVAEALGSDYYALGNAVVVAAGTGAFADVWDIGGHRYIKIKTSAAQTADRLFRVMGVRS